VVGYRASVEWAAQLQQARPGTGCDGMLKIIGYLRVEEPSFSVGPISVGTDTFKILPIEFREIFSVSGGNLAAEFVNELKKQFLHEPPTHAVKHCNHHQNAPASTPYRIWHPLSDDRFWYGAPVVRLNPDPPSDISGAVKGTVTFTWQEGIVVASGTPSVSTTIQTPVGNIPVTANVPFQITAGPVWQKDLDFSIWYSNDRCYYSIDPKESTSWQDADAVYTAPGFAIVT
jgi:hypothetical protein